MTGDDSIPLKRVLALCDVSRATLWRVARARAGIFPAPERRAGRLYWRGEDIAAIKQAIAAFEGRTVFDQQRVAEKQQAAARYAALRALKHKRRRARLSSGPAQQVQQGDFFDR